MRATFPTRRSIAMLTSSVKGGTPRLLARVVAEMRFFFVTRLSMRTHFRWKFRSRWCVTALIAQLKPELSNAVGGLG